MIAAVACAGRGAFGQTRAPHGSQVASRQNEQQRARGFVQQRGIGSRLTANRQRLPPAEALWRARAQHAAMLRRQAVASSSPATAAWQPVGPLQVNTTAWNLVTGRVTAIAADPSDSTGNTVYVGTTGGGVWKSENAAGPPASASFAPLTDDLGAFSSAGLASLSIGAVTVQPGGTGVVLAGTGDPNDATDSWYGVGVLRSMDNGNTWSLISQTSPSNGSLTYTFFGRAFVGFAWSSTTPDLVVAAVTQSEYGSLLQMPSQSSLVGIYYSSDAGVTWQMATIEDGSQPIQSPSMIMTVGNAATSVVWNPIRQRFYAAIRYHGYYESSDGITWTRLANQPGLDLTTAYCPSNPGSTGSPACPIFRGTVAAQPVTGDLFALTVDENNIDQGLWQDACQPTSGVCASGTVQFATQILDTPLDSVTGDGTIPDGGYTLALSAAPAATDTLLFVGTTDLWRCSLANSCSWRNTTNTQTCAAAQVAESEHAIDATFAAAQLLYFGNDGGLWRTSDAVNQQQPPCSADDARHFQNLNGALGSLAEVKSFSEDPNNAATWLAALGELGTAAPAANAAPWNQVLNGEGDVVAIDPVTPDNWYATSEFGVGINQCAEGDACNIAAFGSAAIGETQVENDVQLIPAPWILDPQNPTNLILGTCRVWRGSANGVNWSGSDLLSDSLDGQTGGYCDGDSEIRSLAAGVNASFSSQGEQLYAGMAGSLDGGTLIPGHVFTAAVSASSRVSSTTWTDDFASPVTNPSAGGSQFNPGYFDISSLYVDPHDASGQTVYATIQGYFDSSGSSPLLYRSTDAGAHWQDMTANLPEAPANSVVVDPNNANIVYVALDTGVYYTENYANCETEEAICWNVFGTGLPNAPVTSLMAYNEGSTQVLRAATYGRGIWELGLVTAGIAPTQASVNPASLTFSGQQEQTASQPQTLTVTVTGRLSLNVSTVTISGDFTETDNCAGESILPEATCSLQVTFVPSTTGTRQGTLTLYGNVSGGQLTVPLTGTGLLPGDIALTPSSLSFPATAPGAATASQSITVANTGGSPVALTSETVAAGFSITANTCGASLAAQTACEIVIVFEPTASGPVAGALTVVEAQGTLTAPLSGTGQSAATDSLFPLSLAFAAQTVATSSATQTITLTNAGDAPLTGIVVNATGSFTFVNNCGALLQGHASCGIPVSFAPVAVGAQTGRLTVSDEFRSQSVSLSGIGVAPPGVSATPSALSFAGLGVGTTSPAQTVTVNNSGGAALTSLSASVSSGFSIATNTCPSTLTVGAQCAIGVTFTPSAPGSATGSLQVSTAELPAPLSVALSGQGVDFSIAVSGSPSAVVTSGQTASFALTLAGVSGSAGAAALTCSGAPQNATCSVNPTSLAILASGTSSATLNIVTGVATSAALAPIPHWRLPVAALAVLIPAAWMGWRRKKPAVWMAILLGAALLIPGGCGVTASSGSGGGGSGGAGGGGSQNLTPPGNYVITVTATMANVTHTTTVSLTVQ